MIDDIVAILIECTYTGQPDDGIIWVTPVEETIRIFEARQRPPESQ